MPKCIFSKETLCLPWSDQAEIWTDLKMGQVLENEESNTLKKEKKLYLDTMLPCGRALIKTWVQTLALTFEAKLAYTPFKKVSLTF